MPIRNTVGGFAAAALICWGQGAQASTQDLNCLIQPFVVITITTPVGGLLETVQVDRGRSCRGCGQWNVRGPTGTAES